jgi:hypothetical protein
MKILEYIGLDTSRVEPAYRKVTEAIGRGDFRAAQVKKLAGPAHGKFYRARLGGADRLLFTLVRHEDQACALMLEVIAHHDYGKSRFLRGAAVDEGRIPDADPVEAIRDAEPLRYLHPERTAVHLLDKPLSFDDAQDSLYRHPPPLIVAGSAGSGKTALTLEKLKHVRGEVLYVTHSAYLARNARDLYYAHGFDPPEQEPTFLSYREFVESIRVPQGREIGWREFAAWFARMRQSFRDVDGHQAFEEIRGVITADPGGVLSREAYRALGVRQSIFPADRRDALYDLFEKYRVWLGEAQRYDLNLVARDWQALAAPRYDFVVIDEVQDITAVQLVLVLKTLKAPDQFLLCGDSNQIVHPNFFSWAQVKSLFWRDPALAQRQELKVLTANYRNGREATRVANRLLAIKQQRFGSIDRESNFLVQAVGAAAGEVRLIADGDRDKRELDRQTHQSTRFAVLVMREEDKAEARRWFTTPLLFSIHEAKGLEYDNIVLYRFVSDHRAEFTEIVQGVDRAALADGTLDYRRGRDKSDKSLEIYKFFVNALYVALTRAIRNVYLIESDTAHPLFGLLDLAAGGQVQVEARQSSIEDWQKEARKLELQGKQEQAEAIRRRILQPAPVPWSVNDEARTTELLVKVFRDAAPGAKLRQQLYEIATCHDEPVLAAALLREARFEPARNFRHQRATLGRKSYTAYFAGHFKEVLRDCERYGVEHRLPMNLTPLMAAAAAGNVPLVEALLERGADREAVDHYGANALHWAMRAAFRDPKFAGGPFAPLYELLAPAAIDVNTGERLVRIDRHLSEYPLFQTFWVLFKTRFTQAQRRPYAAFETRDILQAWEHLPESVVRPERRRRQHLSAVLARNEVACDYAYNRTLFLRVTQGWYQFNPRLSVRRTRGDGEEWIPIYAALNLGFIAEGSVEGVRERIDDYLAQAGLPGRGIAIVAERAAAREAQRARERAQRLAVAQREQERWRAAGPGGPAADPPWGTPAAKRLAIQRWRRHIEAQRRGGSDSPADGDPAAGEP